MKSITGFLPLCMVMSAIADVTIPPSGNTSTDFPFGLAPDLSGRYQQVYGGPAFGGSPGWIHSLSFFFVSGGQIGGIIEDAQINLSTTSRGVDSLSPVFSENIGMDDRIVAGPGQIPFFGTINLTTPFFYNPQAGNLLLDVRMRTNYFNAVGLSRDLVAANVFGDRVSVAVAFGADSISGNTGTPGLVTRFGFTPVPEPSTYALLIMAFAAALLFRVRKNHHRVAQSPLQRGSAQRAVNIKLLVTR